MRSSYPSVDPLTGKRVRHAIFLLAPGTVVVAVVLQTSTSLTQHLRFDEQRVIELVVLVAIAVASASIPMLRAAVLELLDDARRAVIPILAIVGLGVVSAAAAAEPMQALLEVAVHVLLAWLVTVIAASVRQQPHDASTFLLFGLALAAAIYSLGFLGASDLAPRGQGLWNRSGWGGFTNPRFLGHLYVFTVPLAVAVSSSTRLPRLIRVLAGLVAASGWWAMVLTGGRGTLVAWVVGATAAVVVLGHRGDTTRRFVFRQGAAGLGGIAAGVATRIGLILAAGGDLTFGAVVNRDLTTSSGRLALWDHGLGLAAENPVLGVGPGHYAHIEYLMTPTSSAHPHSLPLQFLSEWGVPVALSLFAVGIASVWRLNRTDPVEVNLPEAGINTGLLRLAVTTSAASGLALSLVSGVGVTPTGQLLLAATLGWLIGLTSQAPNSAGKNGHRLASIAALTVVIIALLPITSTLITATPSDRLENTLRELHRNENTLLQPRFWQQGVIGREDSQ